MRRAAISYGGTTPFSAAYSASSADAGDDCVLTLAASADKLIKVRTVEAGYSSTPSASGLLIIEDGDTIVWSMPMVAGGPAPFYLQRASAARGNGVTLTLTGSTAVLGFINVAVEVW